MKAKPTNPAAKPSPAIRDRRQMTLAASDRIGRFFRLLATPARLRLIHALVLDGELPMHRLADAAGMRLQAASNQVQRLVQAGALNRRKSGRDAFYTIADPCLIHLLDAGWCLLDDRQATVAGRLTTSCSRTTTCTPTAAPCSC
jgi:DNA-binding transcriptional ArsR family regulator